jgi:hypothetical protein
VTFPPEALDPATEAIAETFPLFARPTARKAAEAALSAAWPVLTAVMEDVSRKVMKDGVGKVTDEVMAGKLDSLEKNIRASERERIATAIEREQCGPGTQCSYRFCPDCISYRQAQKDAAIARRAEETP